MLVIPKNALDAETRDRLLEEIVTRDGTDYGATEKSTVQKLTRARNQLSSGFALLVWDPESQSASLLPREQVIALGLDPDGAT